jgi:hypothetical protein
MSTDTQPDNWLHSRKPGRLAIAVAMSAPVAGGLIALVLALTVLSGGPSAVNTEAASEGIAGVLIGATTVMATGFMLGGLIGWPVMLVLGLPAHAALLRKTSAKIWWYIIAGAVIGGVAGGVRLLQTFSSVSPDARLLYIAIGAVTGTLAAVVFWFLRRPDTDAAEYKSGAS